METDVGNSRLDGMGRQTNGFSHPTLVSNILPHINLETNDEDNTVSDRGQEMERSGESWNGPGLANDDLSRVDDEGRRSERIYKKF